MEVTVRCAECNTYLDEHKVESEFGNDACIYVLPCDCVKEE